MQLHVTVAASPQARRGPHEAVQLGGGAPTQDTDAVAVAVALVGTFFVARVMRARLESRLDAQPAAAPPR